MGIQPNPESEIYKEEQRWNTPYEYVEYPKMVYKAERNEDGSWAFQPDRFPASQRIVRDEAEEKAAIASGYRESPKKAVAAAREGYQDIAEEAARRLYEDSRMSEKAREEAKARDNDGEMEHKPELPPVPVPPRPIRLKGEERTARIKELRAKGLTWAKIGQDPQIALTAARVAQIAKKG